MEPDQIEAMNAAERRATETLLLQMERVESLPGVETVALASPDTLRRNRRETDHRGRTAHADRRAGNRLLAGIRSVSPDYANVVRLRLLAGRFFTDRDAAGATRVAVVSESFAREAFGGEPAVGQRLAPSPPSRFRERGATTTAAKLRHGKSSSPAGSRRGGQHGSTR